MANVETPAPRQPLTPITVEVPSWDDLPANTRVDVLDESFPARDQAITVNYVGGRPHDNVTLITNSTEIQESRVTRSREFDSNSVYSFGNKIRGGVDPTDSLTWTVWNQSSTDYTQASVNDPYQSTINYTIRNIPVLEKVRRGMELTGTESELAEEFSLERRGEIGVPRELDEVLKPNLDGKTVLDRLAVGETFDIRSSGERNSVNVLSRNSLRSNGVVAYVKSLEINSQTHTLSGASIYEDDLVVKFEGDEYTYEIEAAGMPGLGDDYTAELHLPFTHSLDIEVYSPNNAPRDIDIQAEIALVERDLVEVALHNISEEVQLGNSQGADSDRLRLFNELRRRMKAGVGVSEYIDSINVR